MLQFSGGQAQTTNAFPPWPSGPTIIAPGAAPAAVLGPTQQGRGVLLSTYNTLTDLQLAYRDEASPGWAFREGDVIQGLYPGSFVFPKAIGFRLRSHNPGQPAQAIAQVWEIDDGPLPQAPLSSNSATLSASGFITPGATGMVLIQTQFSTGIAASFSFAGIPQSFTHLLVLGRLQGFVGATPSILKCQVNAALTGYSWIGQEVISTGAVVNNNNNDSAWRVGEYPQSGVNNWGSFEMWIPNYTDSLTPTFMSESAAFDGANSLRSSYGGSLSGASIGPLTFMLFSGTEPFTNGSKLSLYGIA